MSTALSYETPELLLQQKLNVLQTGSVFAASGCLSKEDFYGRVFKEVKGEGDRQPSDS